MAKPKIRPRIFKGARDFLPEQMMIREEIQAVMRSAFQKYGFEPIETPAIEYLEVLSGKYGDDADRLIYRLNYKTGTKDEAALHYDLTVPFSRMIAMNPNIPMPFKRYQIQPVWRADTPQPKQGRFREFYQCDIDAVGTTSMLVEAEIIAIFYEVLTQLGIQGFLIKINNRKILSALVRHIGLTDQDTQEVCRSVDKLDKVPFEVVAKELGEKGYAETAVQKLKELLYREDEDMFAVLAKEFEGDEGGMQGIAETQELFEMLESMGIPKENYSFELSLARGLDYYTGCIFETTLPSIPHIGSLTGGGRYDGLIGMFSGKDLPACGASLGLDRIFTAMDQLGILEEKKSRTQVLVTRFAEATATEELKLVTELRQHGINAELYLDVGAKFKKQFKYADRKGIPYVMVLGEDEVKEGVVTVKTLATGEQAQVKREELMGYLGKQ